MATTTELEAHLTAVRSAIYSGARSVQFADRSVTYASMAELRQVEADLVRQLAGRPKQTLLVGLKGFA